MGGDEMKDVSAMGNEELLAAYDHAVDQASAYQAGPEDRTLWLDKRAELLRRLAAPTRVNDVSDDIRLIQEKCEFYWNVDNICNAEVHAVLERIHEAATRIKKALAAPVQPGPRCSLVLGDGTICDKDEGHKDPHGTDTIIRCHTCKSTLLYHREDGAIVVYHTCNPLPSSATGQPPLKDRLADLLKIASGTEGWPTEDQVFDYVKALAATVPAPESVAPSSDLSPEVGLAEIQLQKVFDYFMGPDASGSFTCSCNKPDVCGICELREETKKVIEPLRRRLAEKISLIQSAIAEGPATVTAQPGTWISVKDGGLPKVGQWCWVVYHGVVQRMAAHLAGKGFACADGYEWRWSLEEADPCPVEEITHYWTLPAPPFGATQGDKEK